MADRQQNVRTGGLHSMIQSFVELVRHLVAASGTHGCSLRHARLHPPARRVAAPLHRVAAQPHVRLQVRLPEVQELFGRYANWGLGHERMSLEDLRTFWRHEQGGGADAEQEEAQP